MVSPPGPAPLGSSAPGSCPGDPCLSTSRSWGLGHGLRSPRSPLDLVVGVGGPRLGPQRTDVRALRRRGGEGRRWYPAVPCGEGPDDSPSRRRGPSSAGILVFGPLGAPLPSWRVAPRTSSLSVRSWRVHEVSLTDATKLLAEDPTHASLLHWVRFSWPRTPLRVLHLQTGANPASVMGCCLGFCGGEVVMPRRLGMRSDVKGQPAYCLNVVIAEVGLCLLLNFDLFL